MNANSPIRILTVDDHPVLRRGIAAILEGEADMVLVGEANNGREAIALFRTHHPDITLMDLQMPEMSGIDTIVAIREEFPNARVIADNLAMSEETVKGHMRSILSKLGTNDRTHAVTVALKRGIIDLQ